MAQQFRKMCNQAAVHELIGQQLPDETMLQTFEAQCKIIVINGLSGTNRIGLEESTHSTRKTTAFTISNAMVKDIYGR